jgi:hypothetical protein
MPALPAFLELAADADPPLDLLALALAAEFRGVEAATAVAKLDALASELVDALAAEPETPEAQARAVVAVLGNRHGFTGDTERYDHPANSMLDVVLERHRGLPILLSVVYVEVARRAGLPLAGVGLPGHFVVGHFGTEPPLLLDPFAGGARVDAPAEGPFVRPWTAHETAMRILNNLVATFRRRSDVVAAIHAGRLRLALPAEPGRREALEIELRGLESALN